MRGGLAAALVDASLRLPDSSAKASVLLVQAAEAADPEVVRALIPYLFPRRQVYEPGLLARWLGRSVEPPSGAEPLRALALTALTAIFGRTTADRLPALDAHVRGGTYGVTREREGWADIAVDPGSLSTAATDGPNRADMLGLLTFHRNGYVREGALTLLCDESPAYALPFALVRANDWVPQIRARANRFVSGMCHPGNADQLARLVPLLLRLETAERSDHRELVARVRACLLTGPGLDALLRAFNGEVRGIRRAISRMMLDAPREARAPFLEAALADEDAVIRRWPARELEALEADDPELAERLRPALLEDPSPSLRRLALYSLVRCHPGDARPYLVEQLSHRSGGMRLAARHHLQQLDPRFDFLEYYRRATADSGSSRRRLSGAVLGLGELGQKAEAGRLTALLDHDSPRVVRAALFALYRLDPDAVRTQCIESLADPRPGVARSASDLLGPRIHESEASELRLAAATSRRIRGRTAQVLASAMARTPPWSALALLLESAVDGPEHLALAARERLQRWRPVVRETYTAPPASPEVQRELRELLEQARGRLRAGLVARIEREMSAAFHA